MYAIYIIYVCVFWVYLALMCPHLLLSLSYPYGHHPSYSPVSFPDTRHLIFTFVIWFSLAMAIFVSIGLGLPTGTWWGHWWVHNWRWWIILSLNLSVGNSSRVGDGSPQTLLLPTKLSKGPFFCRASAKAAAVSSTPVAESFQDEEFYCLPRSSSSYILWLVPKFYCFRIDLGHCIPWSGQVVLHCQ